MDTGLGFRLVVRVGRDATPVCELRVVVLAVVAELVLFDCVHVQVLYIDWLPVLTRLLLLHLVHEFTHSESRLVVHHSWRTRAWLLRSWYGLAVRLCRSG